MKTSTHEHQIELTDEQLDDLAGGLTHTRTGHCGCGCGCCCCDCGACCGGALAATAVGG